MNPNLDDPDNREAGARSAGAWSIAQRVASIGSKWITVPLALNGLGRDRYGAWLVIVSMLAWLAWSDLGIPAAITNPYAHHLHRGEAVAAKRLLGAGFAFLAVIGLAIAAVLLPYLYFVGGAGLIGVPDVGIRREVDRTLLIVVAVSLATLPLRLLDAIALAEQKIRWLAVVDTVGAIATLACVIVWRQLGAGLEALAVATLVPGVVSRVVLWAILGTRESATSSPQLRGLAAQDLRAIVKRGGAFTIGTVAEVVITQAPVFFVGRLCGLGAVPAFTIPFQLFSTAMQGIVAMLWPYWGVYAEARTRDRWAWLWSMHKRTATRAMLLAVSGFAAVALCAPTIITLWVGRQYAPDTRFLVYLWCLFVVWTWCHVWNVLVTGLDLIATRTVGLVALAIAVLILGPVQIRTLGVTGAALGVMCSLLLTQAWLLPTAAVREYRTALLRSQIG